MKIAEKIVLKTEWSLILFAVTLILFLWPFLSPALLSHLNTLFIYLFTVWAITITILFILSKRLLRAHTTEHPNGKKDS